MVLTFDQWYRYEDIFKMCYPVYVRRENDKIIENKIIDKITRFYKEYGVMFRRILTEPIEISSTQIREMVARGEDISAYVPEAVVSYIKENGLYV
jgi:nicotinate-nucleotide adenylyltransferase